MGLKWRLKQRLARPSRYYGDGGTIHRTGHLSIETYQGRVISVWFRCQQLPFQVHEVDSGRVVEMAGSDAHRTRITGVEVRELDYPPRRKQNEREDYYASL